MFSQSVHRFLGYLQENIIKILSVKVQITFQVGLQTILRHPPLLRAPLPRCRQAIQIHLQTEEDPARDWMSGGPRGYRVLICEKQ